MNWYSETQKETYYFTEEQVGILCSGIRALENEGYINEETFEKAEKILYYLCEGIEPDEND